MGHRDDEGFEERAYREVVRSVYVGERLRRELEDQLSPVARLTDQTITQAIQSLLALATVDLKSDNAYRYQRDVQVCLQVLETLGNIMNTSDKDSDLLDDEENFQVRKLVGSNEVNDA